MIHKIKLNESPFERIKNGTKTIEFRLYDEKRQQIKISHKGLSPWGDFRGVTDTINKRTNKLS